MANRKVGFYVQKRDIGACGDGKVCMDLRSILKAGMASDEGGEGREKPSLAPRFLASEIRCMEEHLKWRDLRRTCFGKKK